MDRYVEKYDPDKTADDYLSAAPGVIVRIEPEAVAAWDYADESFV